MTPYYQDEAVTIYHGDCRDVLSGLERESVDLLLTDPPFGMGFIAKGQSPGQQGIAADGVRAGVRIVRQALVELAPLLKNDAHLLMFCHWQSWPDFYDALGLHAKIRNALIWHKRSGGQGSILTDYLRNYEVILYATRGNRKIAGDGSYSAVIDDVPRQPQAGRSHPTEKPTALLERFILRHAPIDALVMDPFMGGGSTLRAAKNLGRKAIGIEIEERYCEIAAYQMTQEVLAI